MNTIFDCGTKCLYCLALTVFKTKSLLTAGLKKFFNKIIIEASTELMSHHKHM